MSGGTGCNNAKLSSRAWHSLEPALSPWILEAVSALGFAKMTPVQASTLPLFMGNKDVVVEAVTGSGKTLSFLIPVVERITRLETPTKKHHVCAIVVAPTRELAIQIEKVLDSLITFHTPSAAMRRAKDEKDEDYNECMSLDAEDCSLHANIVSQLLVSGTNTPNDDLQSFLDFSPNVLVGTPGRTVELLSSSRVHCPQSSFEILVLDEADRLLDLGFKDDLQKIIGLLPKQRRTGLFSASVSEALDQLIRVGLRNPVHIAVKVKGKGGKHEQRTPSSLQMSYVVARASEKLPVSFKILAQLLPTPQKSIIYLSTCAAVDYFQHVLTPLLAHHAVSYALVPLHGKHTPQVRTKNFARFANSLSPSILLTTDVAARGLDIPQVDLVLQIDPPLDPKVFLHRCGRAGRAGRKGLAIIFLRPGHEEDYVPFLDVRKTPIMPFDSVESVVDEQESQNFARQIRDLAMKDRAIHDKAQRGFVSAVQAYRKHQTKSIFRVEDLDWGDLADGWGLLKLPKMPELKNWRGDPGLGLGIDFETYRYSDKKRENARTRKENSSGHMSKEGRGVNAQLSKRAWSDKLDQKDGREKRRERKKAKRERLKWASMTTEEKEKQADLERLIEIAKNQRATEEIEFEGFGD